MSLEHTAIRTTYFSIVGNAFLALIKFFAGLFGNSYALIADAIESTTDILTSLLVLMGLRYAKKPADENHPYGHGRIEPLVTFLVVGFLIAAAIKIAHDSILNIRTPHEVPKGWTLIVLGVIIAWKEVSYRFVKKRSVQTRSTSLRADAWHHRSDALTSVAAFIGICIAVIFGEGYESADDWAALAASVLIIYNSYLIFRPALGEIMDEHVHDDMVRDIRTVSLTVDGIRDTEKCFIRKTGMKYHVDLHAIVDGNIPVREGHRLAHELQDKLYLEFPEIANVLIHIEPEQNGIQP